MTETYDGARLYALNRNISCPHCKTRIVAGRELEVIPNEVTGFNASFAELVKEKFHGHTTETPR